MDGFYPAGASDNDPHFDLPSVGEDENGEEDQEEEECRYEDEERFEVRMVLGRNIEAPGW